MEGVFKSWMGKRAVDYRRQFNITPDLANGTAVNICTMVFGNMGNDSRHRRGLHPGPGHRRKQTVRRLSDQRPGRGCGGGYPHSPAPEGTAHRYAGHLPGAGKAAQHPGKALPGGAGLRVHHRGWQALYAPDPQWQNECLGPHQDLGGHVQGRPDFRRGGPAADRAGHAGTISPPAHRPGCQDRASGRGDLGLARRGHRQGSIRRRPGRENGKFRGENHPDPHRDQAGRHPRFLCGPGDPHQPGRQDLPRRGGGPGHGQTLRLRGGGPGYQL